MKDRAKKPVAAFALASVPLGGLAWTSCGGGSSSQSKAPSHVEKAEGIVECPPGQPVVGIWVDASNSPGYAHPAVRSSAESNVASYSRNVSDRTNYAVHVGCGGTPKDWAHQDYAQESATSGHEVTFVCGPDPKNPTAAHGICTLETP